jgi:hypothetical protein
MDTSWIFMIIIWAFIEFFGLIIKKSFPKRMKYGAIGSTIIVAGIMADGMYLPGKNPIWLFISTIGIYGSVAVVVYFLRLKTSNIVSKHIATKKRNKFSTILIKITTQLFSIFIGFGIGILVSGLVVGGLYFTAN